MLERDFQARLIKEHSRHSRSIDIVQKQMGNSGVQEIRGRASPSESGLLR